MEDGTGMGRRGVGGVWWRLSEVDRREKHQRTHCVLGKFEGNSCFGYEAGHQSLTTNADATRNRKTEARDRRLVYVAFVGPKGFYLDVERKFSAEIKPNMLKMRKRTQLSHTFKTATNLMHTKQMNTCSTCCTSK